MAQGICARISWKSLKEGILHRCTYPLQPTGGVPMPLPLPDPDTLFEELLQDLPSESVPMAREFKAFVRANKSSPPSNSCGWSSYMAAWTIPCARWRDFTLLYESIRTHRLRSACGLWSMGAGSVPKMVPSRRGPPSLGLALAGHRRQQSKAQAPRARSIACTSRWTWSRYSCSSDGHGPPYRRNSHAFHVRAWRYRGSRPRLCPCHRIVRRSRRGPTSSSGSSLRVVLSDTAGALWH